MCAVNYNSAGHNKSSRVQPNKTCGDLSNLAACGMALRGTTYATEALRSVNVHREENTLLTITCGPLEAASFGDTYRLLKALP